jgi:glycosyltransferase involved in cell wall biosynthesis
MTSNARRPWCSVVIPVYNRVDMLCEVLKGLSRQTAATDAFEVLVCDDGSTEPLDATIESFRKSLPHIQHLRQPNHGPAAARNLGIQNAVADVVVFLDSDVIPASNVLEQLNRALVDHPDWQGAEAKLVPIGGQDSFGWDAPRSDNGGHYHTAGIAYRKCVLEKVGGLDESFSKAACEDVELAVQVLRHGPIGFVPDAVIYHPRRRRTAMSCWRGRKNWRYVQILASRYGFLAWPENKTSFPRLRTALCAIATLPAGRSLAAIKRLPAAPGDAIRGLGFALIDWLGGVSMLPVILFAPLPRRRSSLSDDPAGGRAHHDKR